MPPKVNIFTAFFSNRELSGEERMLTVKGTESKGKGIPTLSEKTLCSKSTTRYGLPCRSKRTGHAHLNNLARDSADIIP